MADMPLPTRMTVQEIEALYPNHWILIAEPGYDEKTKRLSSGVVASANKSREEFIEHERRLSAEGVTTACFRTPSRVMTWLFRLTPKTQSSQ